MELGTTEDRIRFARQCKVRLPDAVTDVKDDELEEVLLLYFLSFFSHSSILLSLLFFPGTIQHTAVRAAWIWVFTIFCGSCYAEHGLASRRTCVPCAYIYIYISLLCRKPQSTTYKQPLILLYSYKHTNTI